MCGPAPVRTVGGVKLALALLFSLVLAAPAAAADTVVHNAGTDAPSDLDSYGSRVAWTQGDYAENGRRLWTLEKGVATRVKVKPFTSLDVTAGPQGQPVAVYNRCAGKRCTFFMYDFQARRESQMKGAPAGGYANWRFWRDRFALIRNGRFVVVGLDGSTRDVGRAKSLTHAELDFNGEALTYINEYSDHDYYEYEQAYFPVTGKGRIVNRAAYGASGDLSLSDARADAEYGYAAKLAGEFGGDNRLLRVNLKTGKRQFANLPTVTGHAVHIGDKQALVLHCSDPDDDGYDECELILSDLRYRDA
jgi:hypothetical protein